MEYEGDIENLAEEESADIAVVQLMSTPQQTPTELPKVTAERIRKVCDVIKNDNCLPSELKDLVFQLNCADLENKLVFLNDCLVPRGKFKNAAKDKSWSAYYRAFTKHHEDVSAMTASPAATAWICLKLFDMMIHEAYDENISVSDSAATEIHESETDIVKYVGGAVVKKLKQRVWRLKRSTYKEEKLRCLEALACAPQSNSADTPDMTSLLDRGGLTYIKPNILQMFLAMEQLFRETAASVSTDKAQDFTSKCMDKNAVSTCFYDTLYEFELSENVQKDTLQNILHLYFKIRIHHKLKLMMDTRRRDWKEKSMRRKLKSYTVDGSQIDQ